MKYFFLGICGISMRSLAVMLRLRGDEVSGCDAEPSDLDFFKTYGVEVLGSRVKEEIKKSDIIVFSSAIKENDENYLYAKKLGKKLMSRGELLGVIASDYDIVIAVAGAHGKTTTTALIYNILKKRNPTLHLGGILKEEDTCFVYGEKRYFITEACEYHDNFLYLKPCIGVITNIEKEHLDYFKTFENELSSFNKFRKNCKFVIEGNGGFEIKKIHHRNQKLCFDIFKGKEKIMSLKMNICEEVNVNNALLAYRVCKMLGVDDGEIKMGLESFLGVKRRFEKVESSYFKDVIVDYAHHPTEIKGTILTAKNLFKKVVFVFQPHTYSRTKELFDEFVDVFKKEKNLVIFKTFPARETEKDGISGKVLAEKLGCLYFEDVFSLICCLKENYPNFAVIFIGAGDLPKLLENEKIIKNN